MRFVAKSLRDGRARFCATGKEGFTRNLLPGEIVEQVLIAQNDMGTRVSNVVIMGQGEPFLNYGNTLAALRFLNGKDGSTLARATLRFRRAAFSMAFEHSVRNPSSLFWRFPCIPPSRKLATLLCLA